MVPQTCHALSTRTCEYLANVLCSGDLDMENYPGLFEETRFNHRSP